MKKLIFLLSLIFAITSANAQFWKILNKRYSGTDSAKITIDSNNVEIASVKYSKGFWIFKSKNRSIKINNTWFPEDAQTIYVGANAQFTTLDSAFRWLNVNISGATTIKLLDQYIYIVDSCHNDFIYPITIHGRAGLSTTILAFTGLTGKPMITAYSPLSIRGCALYGRSLASYGTADNEDAIQVKGTNASVSLIDVGIIGFYRGVNVSGGGTLSTLYTTIDSCYRGIRVNSTDTTSLSIGTTEINNCSRAVSIEKAIYSDFILTNIDFKNSSVDTAFVIDTNYVMRNQPFLGNSRWNGKGSSLIGFDWDRTDGYFANVYVKGVVGIEDATPDLFALYNNSNDTTRLTTQNTWYKMKLSTGVTIKENIKFKAESNKFTYLSTIGTHARCVSTGTFRLDGTNQILEFAYRLSGGTITDAITFRYTTSGASQSTPDIKGYYDLQQNDYIELWVRNTTSDGKVLTAEDGTIEVKGQ